MAPSGAKGTLIIHISDTGNYESAGYGNYLMDKKSEAMKKTLLIINTISEDIPVPPHRKELSITHQNRLFQAVFHFLIYAGA